MRKNQIKDKKPKEEILDQDCHVSTIASATDYTGLKPSPPLSEEEAESYDELYDTPETD